MTDQKQIDTEAADRIRELEAENKARWEALKDALDEILTLYAWSDQVGLYDIEEQPAVVRARAALAETAHCCICGAIVDTRAVEDGGDTEGRQMDDGAWVCSSECWDADRGHNSGGVLMGNAPERIWFTEVDNDIVPNSKRTRPEDVEYVRAIAARDARDEQVREQALREAASHFIEQDIADEILALIEGNQTDE